MTGPELLERRIANKCIGCGWPGMHTDPETGFPDRYCDRCRKDLRLEPGPQTGAAKERRTHKERGIQNLLDLGA